MSNPVPLCTHVKADGIQCGSPAVSGTELCYHHSAVKKTLGKAAPGAVTPVPFLFPEDRASLQINYFLLFQAFLEERIERRDADLMFRMLKEMGRNLGKSGSLVDDASDQRSAVSDQEGASGKSASNADGLESLIDLKASAAIAPESCFSKNPQGRASKLDPFRISTLDLAQHGFRQAAQPITR